MRRLSAVILLFVPTLALSAMDGTADQIPQREPAVCDVAPLLERQDAKQLRELGDRATPYLIEQYKNGRQGRFILAHFVETRSTPARRFLEQRLLKETDSDSVWATARALGMIGAAESRQVLLKKLETIPAPEPNRLGVMLGGGSDGAHFMLIWAVARIEGKDFGGLPPNHSGQDVLSCTMTADGLNACLDWWLAYRSKPEPGK